MTKKISVIIDFDDTLVESNTARDVLLEFVPSEYEEIANLYKSKNEIREKYDYAILHKKNWVATDL